MKVLIFETSLSGHRGYYVRLLVNGLLQLGVDVAVSIPEAEAVSDEFQCNLADLAHDFQLKLYSDNRPAGMFRKGLAELHALRTAASDVQPKHIYVPYGPTMCRTSAIDVVGRLSKRAFVETLLMRSCSGHRRSGFRSAIRDRVGDYFVKACPWDRIHVLDPLSHSTFQRLGVRNIRLMPEAIEDRVRIDSLDARLQLGLPTDRRLITCPGMISERKGADLLLRAFSRSKAKDTTLTLLGCSTPGIRSLVHTEYSDLLQSGRIIFRESYLTNQQLDLLFDASDLIAVPYPDHIGSASILLRAGSSGIPVISADFAWLGWATETFGLGVTVDPRDTHRFSHLLSYPEAIRQVPGHESLRSSYFDYHRPENQIAHWLKLLGDVNSIVTPQCTPFPGLFGVSGSALGVQRAAA